jgi:hypothetical protein
MCGVGKFQKLWRMRETAACPHCSQFQDAWHAWKCQSSTVSEIWTNSISNLQRALHKLDTDPDLIKSIITYLNTWRSSNLLQPIEGLKYRHLLELRDTIGTRQFFEGWLHQEWETIQVQYYLIIKSRQSSKWWTIAFITKLWDVAWDLWDFRNAVYHHQQNQSLHEDTSALDVKVRDLFNTLALTGLLPKDKHLTSISITWLLLFQRSHKVEWLEQATLSWWHSLGFLLVPGCSVVTTDLWLLW